MLATEIVHVAERHELTLAALPRAADETAKALDRLRRNLGVELRGDVPADIDVVLLGSFGRREITSESDCDYLVVLDGTPNHRDIQRVVRAVERTRDLLRLKEYGRTGTFGDVVTATELFARIGLDSDSNANTTRRLLLLCESVSALHPDVSRKIRRSILERYLGDYAPEQRRDRPVRVPHFLLNDLVRYWRTVAVDFGAKQWRALSDDWYVRYAKLLVTRKVLFAGTLAVLLDTSHALRPLQDDGADAQAVFAGLLEHLETGLERSPLARLMVLHDRLEPAGQAALAVVLRVYDEFLGMLDDPVVRSALAREHSLAGEAPREQVRRMGEELHEAVVALFHDDPLLRQATRRYAVF